MRIKQGLTLLYLLYLKQLRNIGYIVALILLPILLSLLINTNAMTKSTGNNIGLFCDSSDQDAVNTIEYLINGDYFVNFIKYDDKDEMINDIKNNRIDCAYEFPTDLADRIIHKPKNSITLHLYDSETLLGTYANEIIFTAILRNTADDMLMNYVDKTDVLNDPEVRESILKNFEGFIGTDDVFRIEKISMSDKSTIIDEDALTNDDSTMIRYISGILVMLAAFIGAVYRSTNMNTSAFEVMDKRVKDISAFIYPLSYATPVMLSCTLLIVATKSSHGFLDIFNILGVLLAATLLAAIIALTIKNSKVVAGMIPILLMISVTIYPVFFDFEMFIPWIHYIKYLLPPQYINLF